jgi:hypothetical protein
MESKVFKYRLLNLVMFPFSRQKVLLVDFGRLFGQIRPTYPNWEEKLQLAGSPLENFLIGPDRLHLNNRIKHKIYMPPAKKRPTKEEIQSKFTLPLSDAAKELGICRTLLKRT